MEQQRTVGFALKVLANQVKRVLDNNVQKNSATALTGMQFMLIAYIGDRCRCGDVFQKDIEAEFSIRRSTATGILQLMEKNGLITREPVAYDARLKKLSLTDKATDIQDQAIREIILVDEQLTRGISPEDLDTFYRVIDAISKNAGE